MNDTAKKIALSLALLGTLVGGTFVWNEGTRPAPLTYEEQQTLFKIYNYEIQKAGGTITLDGVTEGNLIEKLNTRLSDPSLKEDKNVQLPDEELLTSEQYEVLKTGLMEKSEQKTTLEKILE